MSSERLSSRADACVDDARKGQLKLFGAVLGWLGRHAILFAALLAAIVGYAQYQQSMRHAASLGASVARLQEAETELRTVIGQMKDDAVTRLSSAQQSSVAHVDRRLAEARQDLSRLEAVRPSITDLLRSPRAAIVADGRRRIDAERLRQEIGFLTAVRANLADRGAALSLDRRITRLQAGISSLDARFSEGQARFARLEARPFWGRYRREGWSIVSLAAELAADQARNRRERAAAVAELDRVMAIRRQTRTVAALATPKVAVRQLEDMLEPLEKASALQTRKLEATAARAARRWYERLGVADALWPAIWALVGIILAPFVIRTLFYWVLAPLASAQRPVVPLGPTPARAAVGARSAVSQPLSLAMGEELLVKQGFLQSVPHAGTKETQMLLDACMPISSLAAGLFFLTRIRGTASATITISATRDPFAELAILDLPAGAACVLQPRAIVGVIQPMTHPLRITRHWRFGTLHAWLTLQLRYLVFHGPAHIILKGGRGVRIEAAEGGRSVAQDQLLGFSAGLAYSTGRTETFLPYLFGQESLLKDRVARGSGVLIVEEAPMAGRRGNGIRARLEGLVDAGLKIFGL